jgi:hypothetical protein
MAYIDHIWLRIKSMVVQAMYGITDAVSVKREENFT